MIGPENLGIFAPTPLDARDYTGIRAALDRDGVCVVHNVLTEAEKCLFLDGFWEAVEKRHSKLRRADSSTWISEHTDWHGTFGAGQYKHYGMAQESHCWLLRLNPGIREIFERGVYSADGSREECCVSLDGCAALFRPAVSGLKLHVDQVPGLQGDEIDSFQASYGLYPVGADSTTHKANAGFVCVVGSHKLYDSIWDSRRTDASFKLPKKHWHVLEDSSPLQCQASIVTCPENSLVIWKSTLLHKNYGGDYTPGELGRSEGAPRLCRLAQFITFMPKKYRSQESLLKKARAVIDGCGMNHWAAMAFRTPTIPFPAWSAAAKAVPVVIPKFYPDAVDNFDEKVLSTTSKKRSRQNFDESYKATKQKDALSEVLRCLPKGIQSVL